MSFQVLFCISGMSLIPSVAGEKLRWHARLARLVHPVNQTTVLLGQRFSQTDFWTLPLRRQRVQTRMRFV